MPQLSLQEIVDDAKKVAVELERQQAPEEVVRIAIMLAELARNMMQLDGK